MSAWFGGWTSFWVRGVPHPMSQGWRRTARLPPRPWESQSLAFPGALATRKWARDQRQPIQCSCPALIQPRSRGGSAPLFWGGWAAGSRHLVHRAGGDTWKASLGEFHTLVWTVVLPASSALFWHFLTLDFQPSRWLFCNFKGNFCCFN